MNRFVPGALFACVLTPQVTAQNLSNYTFSIDYHGPTRSLPECATPFPISAADVLAPCTSSGQPEMPVIPGALPVPRIAISSGPTGLGLATFTACFGAPPGVPCPAEIDALSYGADGPVDPNVQIPGTTFVRKANYHFSVDEFAVALPFPVAPRVFDEFTVGDAAADVFVDLGFMVPPPFPPFVGGNPGHNADVDGDGRPQFPTYWAYPGLGLREPTAPGAPPDPGDNLDALDIEGAATGALFPVYYSLDGLLVDPRNGVAGSGTAQANGFSAADVLTTAAPGGPPALFAPAALLGLDFFGPNTDDLDAMILWENGSGAFEPSLTPYDWTGPAPAPDMLLFSVRSGSAVIGMPDSRFNLPIEPGDILSTPLPTFAGGVSPFPSLWIPAEDLGLRVSFARLGSAVFGDDVDALDFSRQKPLLHHEYCFGDGGLSGCTSCPCGNNMPAGNQTGCMNSTGGGARLWTSGLACITADSLRFEVTGATPNSFAILNTASNRLPNSGPCPPGSGNAPLNFDGLRCIGGNLRRAGTRATDANGNVGINNAGWGPPNGPLIGLLAQVGWNQPCQATQWQVFYRELTTQVCFTGLNTTQGVQVVTLP